jgi:hypothetical protein
MPGFRSFDFWFQPKRFESEQLYERLGVLLMKRYVPTGGDLVMQHLRAITPNGAGCLQISGHFAATSGEPV